MIVHSDNPDVRRWRGIHLFHSDISNCSMRVRMALSEKRLPWESHHLDLMKKETISEYYFSIHPKGLVPCLIHDGVVHIESIDIIEYLETICPEPPLTIGDGASNRLICELARAAGKLHLPAVKPFIYANKMAPLLAKSGEEQARYDDLQVDVGLRQFHRKHAAGQQFSAFDLDTAAALLHERFHQLQGLLSDGRPWLAGESFSLADIAWIPTCFTLAGAGFDLDVYPAVSAWLRRSSARPSFIEGISRWCPDFAKVGLEEVRS